METAQNSTKLDDKVHLKPEEWVDAYGDILFRYAVKKLQDASLAEELVQEAFLSGVKAHQNFEGRGNQLGWLTRILQRKISDHWRKTKSRREAGLEELEDMDVTKLVFDQDGNWHPNQFPKTGQMDNIDKQEFWKVVEACLKKLPPVSAEAFLLRVVDNYPVNQISEELEISPSNVSVRLHRTRLSLAKCVGSQWAHSPMRLGKSVSPK